MYDTPGRTKKKWGQARAGRPDLYTRLPNHQGLRHGGTRANCTPHQVSPAPSVPRTACAPRQGCKGVQGHMGVFISRCVRLHAGARRPFAERVPPQPPRVLPRGPHQGVARVPPRAARVPPRAFYCTPRAVLMRAARSIGFACVCRLPCCRTY
jgi:hypothetical protein